MSLIPGFKFQLCHLLTKGHWARFCFVLFTTSSHIRIIIAPLELTGLLCGLNELVHAQHLKQCLPLNKHLIDNNSHHLPASSQVSLPVAPCAPALVKTFSTALNTVLPFFTCLTPSHFLALKLHIAAMKNGTLTTTTITPGPQQILQPSYNLQTVSSSKYRHILTYTKKNSLSKGAFPCTTTFVLN